MRLLTAGLQVRVLLAEQTPWVTKAFFLFTYLESQKLPRLGSSMYCVTFLITPCVISLLIVAIAPSMVTGHY